LNTEDTSELDVLTDHLLHRSPDLEAMAAMKRIQILSESSEAFRTRGQKLSIPMSSLDLDKGKSQSRSTGICKTVDTEQPLSVLIEWKKYEGYWDSEIGNTLFNRWIPQSELVPQELFVL